MIKHDTMVVTIVYSASVKLKTIGTDIVKLAYIKTL